MRRPRIRINKAGFKVDDRPQRIAVPIPFTNDNGIVSTSDDTRHRRLNTLHSGLIPEEVAAVQSKSISRRSKKLLKLDYSVCQIGPTISRGIQFGKQILSIPCKSSVKHSPAGRAICVTRTGAQQCHSRTMVRTKKYWQKN